MAMAGKSSQGNVWQRSRVEQPESSRRRRFPHGRVRAVQKRRRQLPRLHPAGRVWIRIWAFRKIVIHLLSASVSSHGVLRGGFFSGSFLRARRNMVLNTRSFLNETVGAEGSGKHLLQHSGIPLERDIPGTETDSFKRLSEGLRPKPGGNGPVPQDSRALLRYVIIFNFGGIPYVQSEYLRKSAGAI